MTPQPTPAALALLASLAEYITPDGMEKSKRIFDGNCSHELLVIATALRGLAEACDDAAQFCYKDGRDLTAEGWESRAQQYRNCHDKIVDEWDGDPDHASL